MKHCDGYFNEHHELIVARKELVCNKFSLIFVDSLTPCMRHNEGIPSSHPQNTFEGILLSFLGSDL